VALLLDIEQQAAVDIVGVVEDMHLIVVDDMVDMPLYLDHIDIQFDFGEYGIVVDDELKVVEHSTSLLVLLGSDEEHDALERSHQVLFLHYQCSLHEVHVDNVVVDNMPLHNVADVERVDVDVVELLISVDILAAAADVDDRHHHVGGHQGVEGFPVYGYY